MKILLIIATLALVSCSSVSLKDPSEVTDQQISKYKYGIERGCKDNGISKGDSPEKVEAFCNCALDTLNKNVTRVEWQKAYYFSVKHMDREEMQIMAPHSKATEVCRASP